MNKHKTRRGTRILTYGEVGEILGIERHRVGEMVREEGIDLRDAVEVVRFVVWWVKREEELRAVVE